MGGRIVRGRGVRLGESEGGRGVRGERGEGREG